MSNLKRSAPPVPFSGHRHTCIGCKTPLRPAERTIGLCPMCTRYAALAEAIAQFRR